MRRLLSLLALLPALALAAPPTVTITGGVFDVGGVGVTSGRITCKISQPGSVLDGATSVRVGASTTITLLPGGGLPSTAKLIPNEAITPVGTAYICTFSVVLASQQSTSWVETLKLDSSPATIDIGAVPRLNVVPGVAVGLVPATATVTGGVRLTGDLGGTATAPTVANASNAAITASGTPTARTAAARAADEANLRDFDASGDGSADDRPALVLADAKGAFRLPKGTYRVASDLTLVSDLVFDAGAVVAPDAGVTVTITGGVRAGNAQIFTVGAGAISFAGNRKMTRVLPRWWGTTASLATTTVSCTSGSAVVTLSSAQDFKDGQPIYAYPCGANSAVLSALIVSGGGTTSLTLSAPAATTGSGGLIGHDDSWALAAAMVAASSVSHGGVIVTSGVTVEIGPGEYPLCARPVWAYGTSLTIAGSSRGDTALRVIGNPWCPLASGLWFAATGNDGANYGVSENPFTGAALLTGAGSAFQLTGLNSRWLQISDCGHCGDLGGLSAFTAEATVNLATVTNAVILSSSGTRDSVDGNRIAFKVSVASNGALTCRLNVAGTARTVTGAAGDLAAGVTKHVAITYDGSFVRCFAGGVEVGAAVAASGTITQAKSEQVRIGPDTSLFPEGVGTTAGFNGRADGVRLSSSARYTSGFTPPTAKWGTADASTLIQCNFDATSGPWTTCYSGRTSYGGIANPRAAPLVWHKAETCGGGGRITIRDLTFAGGGVYLNNGPNLDMENVGISGTSANSVGLVQGSTCGYSARYRNLAIDPGQSSRVMFATDSGITTIDGLGMGAAGNCPHPIILGGNTTLRGQLFISGVGSAQVFPVIIRGPSGSQTTDGAKPFVHIDGLNSDIEAVMPALQAVLLLDAVENTVITGSQLGCGGNAACYALQVQAGGNVTIQGSALAAGNTTAQIHVAGALPTGRIMIVGSQSAGGAGGVRPARWTDSPEVEMALSSRLFASSFISGSDAVALDWNSTPHAFQLPNAAGGTWRTTLAKVAGAGTALVTATTDTAGAVGVVTGGAGTTGRAQLAVLGPTKCTYDAATTQGDYVQISATQPGACHSAGAGVPGTGQILGRALATASLLAPPASGHALTCSSTGGTLPAGTYQHSNTWVTWSGGETTTSNRASCTCGTGTCSITGLIQPGEVTGGSAPVGAVGWRFYLSAAGGAAGSETLQPIANYCPAANQITLADGTSACTTSAQAVTTQAAGAALPVTNTAGPTVSTFLQVSHR